MLTRASVVLTRIPVTLTYAVVLTAVTTVLLALGPQVQDRVVNAASTNLHNLRHGHFGTLVGSAFVTDAGPIYAWLPGLVCLLALAELFWRSRQLVLTLTLGHLGATLLVALGLAVAVKLGWTPASVSRDIDVGMSYGAATVLGTLTAAIPRRWRPAWIGWWLAVGLAVVAVSRYFTDVGHVTALVLGMLIATRLGRPDRWTRVRWLLLVIAAVFGLMLLASTGLMVVITAAAGLLGAVVGQSAARFYRSAWPRRRVRPNRPVPAPRGRSRHPTHQPTSDDPPGNRLRSQLNSSTEARSGIRPSPMIAGWLSSPVISPKKR